MTTEHRSMGSEGLTAVALLPCPFDGGVGFHDRDERAGYDDFPDDPDRWAYYVQCRTCAAQGPWSKSSRESAARFWNMREGAPEHG